MPTLRYVIQGADVQKFLRPPIFYVSRSAFTGTSSNPSNTVPLISPAFNTGTFYGQATVENVTINVDDQANTAVIRFPKELHDSVSQNVVGSEVKIRLAQFEGLPSEVIFRGVVLDPNFAIAPNADGLSYNCIGYRYILNGDTVWGIRESSQLSRQNFARPAIFNEDDRKDRSSSRKNIGGIQTFVFDKNEPNAEFWTVGDILHYIFAVEASKISGAVNIPDVNYLSDLVTKPMHFELQGTPIASAITVTLRQMGSAYHWWLDDFFANFGGSQSNFRWFIIGGSEVRKIIVSSESILLGGTGGSAFGSISSSSSSGKRVFSIGKVGQSIESHKEYNTGSFSVSENIDNLVNRVIVVGDFVRVETVFQLTEDWTSNGSGSDEFDFKFLHLQLESAGVPVLNPRISKRRGEPAVDKFVAGEQLAEFAHVFRRYKLDATSTSGIFDDIEAKLDTLLGEPEDIDGNKISWFDRNHLPPFDRNLSTQQKDQFNKEKNIRMQVYGFVDSRKREADDTATTIVSNAFNSWTLGTGRNTFVIDPEHPTIIFSKINAGENYEPAVVYVTATLKTNVRVIYDTGKFGSVGPTITRIVENERFRQLVRYKSLVPEKAVSDTLTKQHTPTRSSSPITIDKTYTETIDGNTVNVKTGYEIKNESAASLIQDDLAEMTKYGDQLVRTLGIPETSVTIRVPFANASYKPGEMIKSIGQSKLKKFDDVTITSISIDGVNYNTTVTATNKKE